MGTGDAAKTAYVEYTIAPASIDSVAVTDIDAPAAGSALDTAAATSTANVTLGGVAWEPSGTNAAYATVYTASVTAMAAANYAFSDNVTATVNGQTATVTKNTDGTLTISYTFAKTALNPVTITGTAKEVTYDPAGISIPADMFTIPSDAGTATYSVDAESGAGTYENGTLTVTKAGTFTVTVNTAATETHAAGSASAALTVNKATPTVTAPAAKELTHGDSAQELVTAGTTSGGTLQYAVGTSETNAPTEGYNTAIPSRKDAGTYYVWYKVAGNDLYHDVAAACVPVTIARKSVSVTVTFKVANGAWDDGTTADKTVTLTGSEGETLKLSAEQIPAVGGKPDADYKVGSWNVTPDTDAAIAADTTYTYTYVAKGSVSVNVTFKVANGAWNDETTDDITVTLNGLEGDALKLASNQIPAVGGKPNANYKAGSWDVTPDTDAAITENVTYTYAYAAKGSISVNVTFKVANGAWNDETTDDITVTLNGLEGDAFRARAFKILVKREKIC